MRSSRRIILNHLLALLLVAAMMASLLPAGLFRAPFAAEAFAEELLPGEDPVLQGEEETDDDSPDDDLPGDPPGKEDEEEEEDREQEKEKEEQELKEEEQKEEEKEEEEKEEEEQEEEDLLPENTVILPEGLPEEGNGNTENTDPLPANEEKQEGTSEEDLKEDPEKDPEALPEETSGDVPSGPVTLDGKPVEDSITSGLSLLNPLFPHTEEEILLAEAVTADDQLLRGNRLMASLKPGVSGSTIYSQDISDTYQTLEIDTDDCVSYEEAIAAIRSAMVRREASIDLAYHSGTTSLATVEELSALFDDVAVHTCNPQEGDYLRYHYRQLGINNRLSIRYDGTWYHRYTMHFTYYSTAAQEELVGNTIASVVAQLNLTDETKTDYDRVLAIYKYIDDQVAYENNHAAREANGIFTHYSAYGALLEHTAVCQGYGNLFYRMCLTLGIDARIVSGTSSGTPHAWNIVKVGNAYYPVDATWDDTNRTYQFRYFLTKYGHSGLEDARGASLYSAYGVTDRNYPCNADAPSNVIDASKAPNHSFTVTDGRDVCETCGVSRKHVHSFPAGCETQEKAATCEEAGYLKKKCAECGQFIDTEDRPALGHVPVPMEATETTTGGIICSRCEKILEEPVEGILVSLPEVEASETVYINGVAYSASADETVILPIATQECTSAVTYSYAEGTGGSYPTGMTVWMLNQDETTGTVAAERAPFFDDLMIYAGTSIRLKGDQGIAIHTNLYTATWNLLLSGNYHGYQVEEAGLLVSREEKNATPTYGGLNVTAAPAWQRTGSIKSINVSGNTSYYMNTLVFGSNMECTKWKLACRPYMILTSADGDTVYLYGGILVRSVQSVARQIQGKYSNNASVSAFIQKILDVA